MLGFAFLFSTVAMGQVPTGLPRVPTNFTVTAVTQVAGPRQEYGLESMEVRFASPNEFCIVSRGLSGLEPLGIPLIAAIWAEDGQVHYYHAQRAGTTWVNVQERKAPLADFLATMKKRPPESDAAWRKLFREPYDPLFQRKVDLLPLRALFGSTEWAQSLIPVATNTDKTIGVFEIDDMQDFHLPRRTVEMVRGQILQERQLSQSQSRAGGSTLRIYTYTEISKTKAAQSYVFKRPTQDELRAKAAALD